MRNYVFMVFMAAGAGAMPSIAQAAGGWAWAHDPTASSYDAPPNYSFNSSGGAIRIARQGTGLYTATFDGVSVSGGNAQAAAYGSDNNYCNVRWWGTFSVGVSCFAQGGAPVDSRFVVSLTGYPTTDTAAPSGAPLGTAYVWQSGDSLSSTYSWNSTGGANTLRKLGTGKYEVRLAGIGYYSFGDGTYLGPSAKPLVTAYGTNGYCVAREQDATWPPAPDAVVTVACFTPSGQPADSAFSLIASKSRHMEGPSWAQVWRSNDHWSANWMINGAFYTGGSRQRYPDGWYFSYLIPNAKSMFLVSSCGGGGLGVGVSPGPQRCKPDKWWASGSGVRMYLSCFDANGVGVAPENGCYNGSYMTTQVTPTQ